MSIRKIIVVISVVTAMGVGAWILILDKNGNDIETLVVEPGEFSSHISVAGRVVAAETVELGFAQSGRVSGVYVKVGNYAAAGTTLAELENGDVGAVVLQKKALFETAKANLLSLREGSRPEEIAVFEATVDSDEAALEQARQAVVNSLRDAYTKSEDAIRNKTDQFIVNPRSSEAGLLFLLPDSKLESGFLSKRVAMEKTLLDWKERNASLSVESHMPEEIAYVQQNLGFVSALLADANTALGKAVTSSTASSASLSAWTTDVATARITINTATSALTTAVTAERNEATTLEKDKRSLELTKASATKADIAAQEARVQSAEAEVYQAEANLVKTMIRAPFSGVVTKVDIHAGESVSLGSPIMSVIGRESLQIESYVPEIHIAHLAIGNTAEIELDAYGSIMFPAVVVSIDPAETIRDGISTYRAILQFTAKDSRVKAGMTANITITTEHKTSVISIPQGIVVNENSVKYVLVQMGETEERRTITTGSVSSRGYVEILSGLYPGDVVVLKLAEE
ncbi:MAG: HlyD family secretion protein [Parcubacteria group bacterium Gr01-1014_70]|nr:MAG: HlyD family secretion protein [Parcubacteria group bacterium Gr01-1014_70]